MILRPSRSWTISFSSSSSCVGGSVELWRSVCVSVKRGARTRDKVAAMGVQPRDTGASLSVSLSL